MLITHLKTEQDCTGKKTVSEMEMANFKNDVHFILERITTIK